MQRINNRDASGYVRRRETFMGSNMYANNRVGKDGNDTLYIVYSYGDHFPMYVFDYQAEQWFGNNDQYSNTTARHKQQAMPPRHMVTWVDTATIRGIIEAGGYAAWAIHQVYAA